MTTNYIFDLDLYQILGVKTTATAIEIKAAYRKKALMCHPDKNPNDPKAKELFQQLQRAMEVLSNNSLRLEYDKVLSARTNFKTNIGSFTNLDDSGSEFDLNIVAMVIQILD